MSEEVREKRLRVFVLGNARSGTSIMGLALGGVFKLPGTHESHVFTAFGRMLMAFEKYELLKHPRVLASRLKPELAHAGIVFMARRFYNEQFPAGSWIDKTPGAEAIRAAVLIEEAFPDARIVIMKRNGIEVTDSFRKKFSAPFEQACGAWARGMQGLEAVKGQLKRAIIVDQFDLTNATEETARLICRHLREETSEAQLMKFFRDNSIEKLSTHERTRRLTLADTSWSDEEKEVFTRLCGPAMETWGYPM